MDAAHANTLCMVRHSWAVLSSSWRAACTPTASTAGVCIALLYHKATCLDSEGELQSALITQQKLVRVSGSGTVLPGAEGSWQGNIGVSSTQVLLQYVATGWQRRCSQQAASIDTLSLGCWGCWHIGVFWYTHSAAELLSMGGVRMHGIERPTTCMRICSCLCHGQ